MQTFATAQGELGTFNPWEKEIFLVTHPGRTVIVEAYEISARDGSEQSLVRVDAPFDVARREVTLYFHDPARSPTDCSRVFPVKRELPSSISIARLLVEALIAGPLPSERNVSGSFPQGSELRSIRIANGVATVDFNERLQNVGGSCRAQAIRASVTSTLKQLPGVTTVVITTRGSERLALQP